MRKLAVLLVVWLCANAGGTLATGAEKQEVVNAIGRAAHAYWDQRVRIEHPTDGLLYGYTGAQTLFDPTDPDNRYYDSDTSWVPEPHIFMEVEDSPGHPSVGFAFLKGYEATGDKFLLRAAKQLGDTLISAQADLGVGGWWHDMGVIGYDRIDGSPTFRQIVDFGAWKNQFPWGGHGNVQITTINDKEFNTQDIADFDGCSQIPGLFLLRLYQALPSDDPDRQKYLKSAQWLADEIVGFRDVEDPEGFKPYENGGVPQMWPYNVMKDRSPIDASLDYPFDISHNVMVTLNDDAMPGALFFLIEFWKEAKLTPSLNADKYLEAIRLNVDYLMDAFDLVANDNGRGAWASFYWIEDGSDRARKPTWGRAYEPPGIGFFSEHGDETLLAWYQYETDSARKARIETTLRNFLLYFKYDAPPVNSRPEWRDIIRPYIRGSQYVDSYDPDNILTWQWWLWYNYDESVAPRDVFIASADVYHAYYGEEALIQENNPDGHYPMMRSIASKLLTLLNDQDEIYLFDDANPIHNSRIYYYYVLDPEIRIFRGWEPSTSRVDEALNLLNSETGFFQTADQLPSRVLNDQTYYYVDDLLFQTRMRALAWGAENVSGELTDSDGDGYTDSAEAQAGTDPYDSEYYPGSAAGDQLAPDRPANLAAQAVLASQIDLTWDAAADNVRTTGYKVYRNGQWITSVFRPGYSDTALAAGTEYTYTVSAHDIVGNESAQSLPASATTTNTGNHTPVLGAIGSKSVDEGQMLTFIVTATDADAGDVLTYSLANAPSGASIGSTSGVFVWTPANGQNGEHSIIFQVSDGQVHVSQTVTITVNNVDNRAPVLAPIGNKTANEGQALTFSVSATDADGDNLTYSASGLPSGASFAQQAFAWTPAYTQSGNYNVTFTVSDGEAQDTEAITISVGAVNRPPVLAAIGNRSVIENATLTFSVSATDPDGDSVTYSASGVPSGATFTNGTFSWQPTLQQAGSYAVTFSASDGQLTDTEQITIVVTNNSDETPPMATGVSPVADAIQAPRNSVVTLLLSDAGQGVDANSVSIRVNDELVYSGATAEYQSDCGVCRSNGTSALYRYSYQPAEDFGFDEAVTVRVTAADKAGNVMTPYVYGFRTEMRAFGENHPASWLPSDVDKENPATVCDDAGDIWVVYHAGSQGQRDIYVSKLAAGGAAFGTPIQLTDGTADRCYPDIAVDADGTLYVVWQDNREGDWDIYAATSADGVIWSSQRRVTESGNNQTAPAVAVDAGSSHRAYVVWQDDRATNADIYLAYSTDGFSTKAALQITSNSADQTAPVVAVAGDSTVYVVWTDRRNGSDDVYGAASDVGPWTNVPLATGAGNQSSADVACEATGARVHLVWVDNLLGHDEIRYANSDGLPSNALTGTFIVDDTSGADQTEPAIVVAGSATEPEVFVCWRDERNLGAVGADTDLYFVQVRTGDETNVLIADGGTNSNQSEPVIGVDGWGQPYVVWTDDRNGEATIYHAGCTFMDPTPVATAVIVSSTGGTVGSTVPTEAGDVSVAIPAGACPSDATIKINLMYNPPRPAVATSAMGYEFGPSGLQFDEPVTITIPYVAADYIDGPPLACWYDALTGTFSQEGITDVETLHLSATIDALRFRTTHFTPFLLLDGLQAADGDGDGIVDPGTVPIDGGAGGGGCSLAPDGRRGGALEFILPYIGLAGVMIALKRRDRQALRKL